MNNFVIIIAAKNKNIDHREENHPQHTFYSKIRFWRHNCFFDFFGSQSVSNRYIVCIRKIISTKE